MSSSTSTYAAWQRLSGLPGGSLLFSVAAMARVPYFASVLPHVVRMEPGLAEVRVPKWFFVQTVELLPLSAFCPGPGSEAPVPADLAKRERIHRASLGDLLTSKIKRHRRRSNDIGVVAGDIDM
ncbi:MAG: DUF4442 domain-containing protein, partial [Mycobacterium sp.]